MHVDGPKARFEGKFGVDLLAQFVEPAAPAITTGEWSVMKHVSAAQALAKDWRVFVAPAKPGQEFQVTHLPGGRVITVETPEYRDRIFLAHFPFRFQDAEVTFEGRAGVVRDPAGRGKPQTVLLDGTRLELNA